jgi:hypothetical protein
VRILARVLSQAKKDWAEFGRLAGG